MVVLLFVWTLTWSQTVSAAGPMIRIVPGPSSFSFVDEKGDPSKQITVYTYLPKGLKPSVARIVFVMHGHGKNAKGYRDTWSEHADKYAFMVVAPLFDSEQWGGGEYAYASVVSREGLNPMECSPPHSADCSIKVKSEHLKPTGSRSLLAVPVRELPLRGGPPR